MVLRENLEVANENVLQTAIASTTENFVCATDSVGCHASGIYHFFRGR